MRFLATALYLFLANRNEARGAVGDRAQNTEMHSVSLANYWLNHKALSASLADSWLSHLYFKLSRHKKKKKKKKKKGILSSVQMQYCLKETRP